MQSLITPSIIQDERNCHTDRWEFGIWKIFEMSLIQFVYFCDVRSTFVCDALKVVTAIQFTKISWSARLKVLRIFRTAWIPYSRNGGQVMFVSDLKWKKLLEHISRLENKESLCKTFFRCMTQELDDRSSSCQSEKVRHTNSWSWTIILKLCFCIGSQ